MFRPNLTGTLRAVTGRDVHGRPSWGGKRACAFAIINLDIGALKTSVRADSSASRGSADETAAKNAVILVPPQTAIKIGDLFVFEGASFTVQGLNPRRAVTGKLDHIRVTLELQP
jgi:hypothetical protein